MEAYLYQDLYQQEEEHFWHIAKRELCSSLIKTFIAGKNLQILDVGCGTGKNMENLGQFGKVWGVDLSPHAIAFCKKRGLKNIKKGTSEILPFRDQIFDVVTLLDVLEHTDEDKTLAEIKRVLKPDGQVIISVPAFGWLWSQWDVVLHHKKRYTKNELRQILEKHGFKVRKISYAFSFLVLPALIVRKIKSAIKGDVYTSDFRISNRLINNIFLMLSRIEQKILLHLSIPVGTSLVCVAVAGVVDKYGKD